MLVPSTEFKQRRDKVLAYLAEQNKKLLIRSGSEKFFSNDVHYPFRVDSDFYYLTAFTEPDSALVLDPRATNPYTLYVRPNDVEREIWEGKRAGLEGASNYGADTVLDIAKLDASGEGWLDDLAIVHSLRSIKSAAEVATIKRACQISIQAHQVLSEELVPGIYEYELEATLNHVFRSQGANGWAYPAIVASGANACVLHYIENSSIIKAGDLVLVDAGCQFEYYASDITRVYAASGTMSSEQQDLYDIVVAAQLAAIAAIKPGSSFKASHDAASRVIAEGLKNLGYIKDASNPDELKKYYMHGTGHSLGLDVHDRGIDRVRDKDTIYIPGMVTTVEPGIYVREKGIGIRIEDDVLVTSDGYEVLTAALTK